MLFPWKPMLANISNNKYMPKIYNFNCLTINLETIQYIAYSLLTKTELILKKKRLRFSIFINLPLKMPTTDAYTYGIALFLHLALIFADLCFNTATIFFQYDDTIELMLFM